MKKQIKTTVFATFLMSALLSTSACADDTSNKALVKTHAKISKNYEGVSHIDAQALSQMDEESYILFDVREKDEFVVSHIENSIWVDPSIKVSSFTQQYAGLIGDKTVILYCSVGVRSSQLAEKLMTSRPETDTSPIYNLENGVFGWHNENRPLVSETASTDYIHPYNRLWGRMVNRKSLRRYEQEEK